MLNKKGAIQGAALGFIIVAIILIVISQLPGVKGNFREKKAVGYCQDGKVPGVAPADCKDYVAKLSKDQIMDIIKDD